VGINEFEGNKGIDTSIKNQIHFLNDAVLKSAITNDENALKLLMSDKLLEISNGQLSEMLKQLSFIFKDNSARIYDEYYLKNSNTKTSQTVVSGTSGGDVYKLTYKGICSENYISLLIPKDNIEGVILVIIYGKYDDEWKINMMNLGRLKFDNKNSIQHLYDAETHLYNGHLIDASNSILIAGECLKPFPFWEYEQESRFDELHKEVQQQLQETYNMPIIVDRVKSSPQIYSISPQKLPKGFFPVVKYLSKIDLSDTIALKEENNQLHSVIGDVFAGIKTNNKLIVYKVVNEIPKEGEMVSNYGFLKENE